MLKALGVKNFRNLNIPKLTLTPGYTVIVGDNAQGKSNILEAIYLLSSGKPFRGTKNQALNWSAQEALVSGETDAGKIQIVISREDDTKISIDGKPKNLLALFGKFAATLFYPGEIELASGPPVGRRSWLDRLIATTDKTYLYNLLNYYRSLRNKNRLLKNNTGDMGQLEVWNNNLAAFGTKIWLTREEIVTRGNQTLKKVAKASIEKEIFLRYKNPVAGLEEAEAKKAFLKTLNSQKELEARVMATVFGPHRDDFEIILEEESGQNILQENLSLFGSRGEQRQAVIALKLTEYAYFKEAFSKSPSVLLDDPFSELDEKNRQLLLASLSAQQTILTTTSIDFLPTYIKKKARILVVKRGEVSERPGP